MFNLSMWDFVRALIVHDQNHSWAPSPLSAHSDIRTTPKSDHSDIGLKGSQSDIIANIRPTQLAIFDI
jgi:hypothetical protein